MSEQTSFPGFEPPSDNDGRRRNPREHIFYALVPDSPAAQETLAIGDWLKKSQQLTAPLQPAHMLHVTLRSLPGYQESDTKDAYAKAALAAIVGLRYPQLQVIFDRAAPYGGNAYVLTGDNEKVDDLGKTLGVLLRHAGIRSEQQTPHMTVLYADGTPCKLERPLVWTATEVVLIRSYPGESRHERLGSVPLAPGG